VDEDGRAFAAVGARRVRWWTVLRPRTIAAALRARRRGLVQEKPRTDPWQAGATLVVAPGGRVLLERRNGSVDDDVPLDEVLAVLSPGAVPAGRLGRG
jgi:hypothetical protein